jgi:hypothetical protein
MNDVFKNTLRLRKKLYYSRANIVWANKHCTVWIFPKMLRTYYDAFEWNETLRVENVESCKSVWVSNMLVSIVRYVGDACFIFDLLLKYIIFCIGLADINYLPIKICNRARSSCLANIIIILIRLVFLQSYYSFFRCLTLLVNSMANLSARPKYSTQLSLRKRSVTLKMTFF